MHSHGRSRRKRGHNAGGDDVLLVSRADEPRVDPYSRPHHFSHHTDSYRPSTSTRDSYDISREASSSRSRDEWRPADTSHSSHDRYEYGSTKEVYHRGRDHYDVAESRDPDANLWSSNNSWNPPSHYDYEPNPYTPTSVWPESSTYESRPSGYDSWNAEDSRSRRPDDRSRTTHAVLEDRPVERDSGWHRDGRRKDDKRTWVSDSGWDSRHVERRKAWDETGGWNGVTPSENSYRPEDDRSWQPAPTWQSSNRGDTHSQRNQNGNRNHSKKSKSGKKGNQHNQQKRDWRADDSNLNNWPKRDNHGASNKGAQRSPKKRKQARTPSPSRSPSPSSYYSRRSSRGRSRSRSTSPKRRRRDSSPAGPRSRTPSDRGRTGRDLRSDSKHSKSPISHGRVTRRRSVSSVSTTSRSRSSSPVNRPRAVHRLPAATSIKDIKVAIPTTNLSRKSAEMHPPRESLTHRNGKGNTNGKHARRAVVSASRNDQSSRAPPVHTSSTESMPPPTAIPVSPSFSATSNKLPPKPHSDVPAKESRLGPIKNAGFRPIGQTSSAVKRFFPGDDEDEVADHRPSQSVTPNGSRAQFVPVMGARMSSEGTSHRTTHTRDIVSLKPSPDQRESSPQEQLNDVARTTEVHERLPVPLSPSSHRSSVHDGTEAMQNDSRNGAAPLDSDVLQKAQTEVNDSDIVTHSRGSRNELYTIISQVGEGTFGKVYKARNTVTKVHVALKRIRMATEKDGFPVTAMREIKLLQSLRHENVVRLYEMMVSNADVYMVFEYMDHDLTGVLSQNQFEFTPAHLKSLCHQMLNGLAYLHHKGVIHRDIKGSNILINNRGELKLADFGLARFYQKRRRSDYTNRVITLWYRPPELLFGATIYGPEVDMWSAGCIMLELFTKKPVFQGNDEIHQLDVVYKIFGTPTPERWSDVMNLPWYELVKPKDVIPNRFRELFQKWLSPAALDLAEQLLSYDPSQRITAVQAMEAPYFKQEPAPSLPVGLSTLEGEWHELETKRERAKKRRKTETAVQ